MIIGTRKVDIDKTLLEVLYYDEGYSTTQIGEMLGLNKGQVLYIMRKFNIKRLRRGRKKQNKKQSNYIHIDKDELYDLYWNKGYSLQMLAQQKYFCSHVTIINRMKEYGIPRRKRARGEGRTDRYVQALRNSLHGE